MDDISCFQVLGLEVTGDKRKIRHKYAELARTFNVETNPEEFMQIKEAYDQAMRYASSLTDDEVNSESNHEGSREESVSYQTNFLNINGLDREDLDREALDREDQVTEDQDTNDLDMDDSWYENSYEYNSPEVFNVNMDGIFYKVPEFDAVYGQKQKTYYKSMAGISDLYLKLDAGMSFEFTDIKDYVLSEEFLQHQFDPYYIEVVEEFLRKCADLKNINEFSFTLTVFAVMYGAFNLYFYDDDMLPLFIPIFKLLRDYTNKESIEKLIKTPEYHELLLAQVIYQPMAMTYIANRMEPSSSDWAFLVNEIVRTNYYKLVGGAKQSSLTQMVCNLIRNQKEIPLTFYYYYTLESERVTRLHLPNIKTKFFAPVFYCIQEAKGVDFSSSGSFLDNIKTEEDFLAAIHLALSLNDGENLISNLCSLDKFMSIRGKDKFVYPLIDMLKVGPFRYEIFKNLYTAYLFIPDPLTSESDMRDYLEQLQEYVDKYWNKIQEMRENHWGRQ